jgi:CHAD domain-containing protein
VFAEVEFPRLIKMELDPAWALEVAAQHTVLRYFARLLEQRTVVWENEDVEGVHEIRVAARRTRTALQTLGDLWDAQRVRDYQRYLGRFADAFGAARDLDVMVIYLAVQVERAEGERREAFRWLLQRNTARRAEEQPKLEDALLGLEKDGFPAAFVGFFSRQPTDLWALEGTDG